MHPLTKEMENTFGTEAFEAVFAQVAKLKKAEVVKIGSEFVNPMARSTSKKEALRRIYARHASMVDSLNKQAHQKGKSAA